MTLSAEKLVTAELCLRRYHWTEKYQLARVPLMRALYVALHAGLLAENPEKGAENAFIDLAAKPGLDIEGANVYASAMHHAKLAAILAAALRSTTDKPWTLIPATSKWESACYDMGDGKPRRIALVDRWNPPRRQQEIYGWRTMGEACALDKTIYLTAITIGAAKEQRRHSAWTRCYRHPKNFVLRFQKRKGQAFTSDWLQQWREDSSTPTAEWLSKMHDDGCMNELVHTVEVPVPTRADMYLEEMERIAKEIEDKSGRPPMRFAGCFGFNPCPFVGVCHGPKSHHPFQYGFQKK